MPSTAEKINIPYIKKELPWWKLPSTGFNVEAEVDCLLRIYQDGIKTGEDPARSLNQALSETRGNITGFKFEYIMQRLLLPNPVTLHRVNNRLRLVNSLSLQPLDELTTDKERLGAVKRAVKQVENHLTTDDGQVKMAVVQSPNGWSGFTSPDGKAVVYPDSQTYMFRKNADGTLEAFTAVTSMGFEENRHFLAKLGKDKDKVGIGSDQKDRIADVVDNVVLLSGKQAEIGFSGIINKIQETRQEIGQTSIARSIKQGDGRVEQRGFEEIYLDLQNERLIDSDKYADQAIADFEKQCQKLFSSSKEVSREILEQYLALSVVNVSRAVKGERALTFEEVFQIENGQPAKTQNQSFLREVAYMKTLGGCNGGGVGVGTRGVINTGLGSRLAISGETRSSEEPYHCDQCNKDRKKEELGSCGLCSVCFPE